MAAATQVKLFDKKLTEADVQNNLVLETNSLIHLSKLNNNYGYVDFCAMDENQLVWTFRCFTGYDIKVKPVILQGWDEFVRHYGLKAKDKVNFYENEGNGVPFIIHVRRTIRLFGVDITEAD